MIRRATLDDAPSLAALCQQLGYASSQEQMRERLVDLIDDEDHAVWIIAQFDGQLVGWLHAYLRRSLLIDVHAEIGGLVVAEQYRQRGLGRRLMAEAEAWARDRDCAAVRLRSNVTRGEAHRFYLRLGYQELTMQRAFRKEL